MLPKNTNSKLVWSGLNKQFCCKKDHLYTVPVKINISENFMPNAKLYYANVFHFWVIFIKMKSIFSVPNCSLWVDFYRIWLYYVLNLGILLAFQYVMASISINVVQQIYMLSKHFIQYNKTIIYKSYDFFLFTLIENDVFNI